MSKFHRDDHNGRWSYEQQEARMRPRDRKSTGAKRKHNVVPIETLFPLNEAHGRGLGSAEDKARLAEIIAFKGLADCRKPPFNKDMFSFACCENEAISTAFFTGFLDILEITAINNASGAPQFLEVRYRLARDAAGVKRFAILFRGTSDYHVNEVTGVAPEILVDEWNFLAKAGLFIFHGADDLVREVKAAEANHSNVTVIWCEGMHSKAGVEALLAHPDNLAGVEAYKRLNRTEIVVLAWISALPGIMATNFELRPDDYFVSAINDYKFDWRENFIDRVIVIPDSDNQGMIEAKALVNRLTEEFGLPRCKVDMARHPPGLKKSQIEAGWDDHDPLPRGVTPQDRLAQIFDAKPFETRETILVHPDHMHEAADAVERAMIDAGDYYQHGGEVATIGAPPVIVAKRGRRKKDDGRVIGKNQMERAGQRIYPKSEHGVMEAMSRVARYEEPDRKGKLHAIPPPMSVAKMLMARGDGLKLPLLKTVLDRPTINAEGELMLTPGYDAETGLFLAFDPSDFPTIPDKPTKDDARDGLEILKGLCPEFPFVTPADRSVYLSYLLTGVSRTALSAAPGYGFTATKPRTGKSKLSNSGHMIASGETTSVVTWSPKEEENETRLDTALLAGVSNLAVDNINVVVQSAKLCSMTTEERLTVRVFHTQKKKEMPSVALISLNGNNLQFAGELAKRILRCSLDADVDKPELRVFTSVDPVEQIREDRGKFVMAALTILRAFVVAGYPVAPPTPWGGFEDWNRWVRAALIWLDEPDPYDVMNAAIEDNEERQQQKRMFAALEGVFVVEETFTTADVVKAAKARNMMAALDKDGKAKKDANDQPVLIDQGPKHPALSDVVTEIAMRGRDISAGVLGKWFGKNKNLTLFEDDEKKNTFKRKLIEVTKIDGISLWMLKGKRPNFAGPGNE
jgi:hypothetical protein